MKKYNYVVELDTELGIRKGTMQAVVTENRVNGYLSILNHTEPFCGSISANGACNIRGKIVSLIKEIDYVATGYIAAEMLRLTLKTKAEAYLLKGIAENTSVIGE